MLKKFDVTVPAPSGEQRRSAYVWLPDGYDGEKRYPVLYMFDGHNLFLDEDAAYGQSWKMGEYLAANATPLIVAAVECDKKDRLSEYSPFPFSVKRLGWESRGKGKAYMDWLTGEFKTRIDGEFCTLSDRRHTYIAGSSMGGLMSLYAITAYNGVFSAAAALSPSLWADPDECERMLLSAEFLPHTRIYVDYGSEELKTHPARQKRGLKKCAAALLASGVPHTFRVVDGGTHNEGSWGRQIPAFMECLGIARGEEPNETV